MLCEGEPGITLVNWPVALLVREYWLIIFPPRSDFGYLVPSANSIQAKLSLIGITVFYIRQDDNKFCTLVGVTLKLDTPVVFLESPEDSQRAPTPCPCRLPWW